MMVPYDIMGRLHMTSFRKLRIHAKYIVREFVLVQKFSLFYAIEIAKIDGKTQVRCLDLEHDV